MVDRCPKRALSINSVSLVSSLRYQSFSAVGDEVGTEEGMGSRWSTEEMASKDADKLV